MATDKQKLEALLAATKAKLVTTEVVTSVVESEKASPEQKEKPNQKEKVSPK